jgi:hypothetical protein
MSWWKKTFRGYEPIYDGKKHEEVVIREVMSPDGMRLPEEHLSAFADQLKQGFLLAGYRTAILPHDTGNSQDTYEMEVQSGGRVFVDIQLVAYQAPGLLAAFATPSKQTVLIFKFSITEAGADKPLAHGTVKKKAEHFGLIGAGAGSMKKVIHEACYDFPQKVRAEGI